MVTLLLIAAAAAGQAAPASAAPTANVPVLVAPVATCNSKDPAEIVVCGRLGDRYRIDPSVLQAIRAREAVPPKPQLSVEGPPATAGCIGPHACKGDFVPLVKMGLVALDAATLAARGDDWREAFRAREDEYKLYKEAEERRARERRVTIGFGARAR